MVGFGLNHSYSSLYPIIDGDMPDNSFSEIPYEKGFQLLFHLEKLLGEENMQSLIREHVLKHSQQSVGYKAFVKVFNNFVDATYNETEAANIKGKMDWETWVRAPGLPPQDLLDFTTTNLTEAQNLANEYIKTPSQSPANFTEYNSWYSSLKVIFLEQLIARESEVTLDLIKRIDADLNISGSVDPEVKQRWYPLGIRMKYEDVTPKAHNFISSMGRMKYLTPIYTALLDTDQKTLAVQWFNENIDFYHPYAIIQLKRLLGITEPEEANNSNSLASKMLLTAEDKLLKTVGFLRA